MLLLGQLQLLRHRVSLPAQRLIAISQITNLPLEVLALPLKLVSELRQLLVFLEVFDLQLINLGAIFDSLLLKEFQLLLKCLVASRLNELQSLLVIFI